MGSDIRIKIDCISFHLLHDLVDKKMCAAAPQPETEAGPDRIGLTYET